MVFVDHMNFDINLRSLYYSSDRECPKLDYNTLFPDAVRLIPNIDFIKTFIFTPTPDPFLMQDPHLLSYYKWMRGLKGSKYMDVIEGRYIARPVDRDVPMRIDDHHTYYKEEKGTDINLAATLLSKAYFNSYDAAFIFSADTDYISVYKILKSIGKIVIVVAVQGQRIGKVIPEVDDHLFLGTEFFDRHIRPAKE